MHSSGPGPWNALRWSKQAPAHSGPLYSKQSAEAVGGGRTDAKPTRSRLYDQVPTDSGTDLGGAFRKKALILL